MKFINYLIIRFSILTTLGIVAGHFSAFQSIFFLKATVILVAVLLILWLLTRNQLYQNSVYGIVSYMSFFTIGYCNYQIQLPLFQPNHYSHISSEKTTDFFQLKITDILKPGNYNRKYIAKVEAINGISTSGTILILIQKDSTSGPLFIDDQILLKTTLKPIPRPLNPGQFNYSKYMETLGIYDQIQFKNRRILMKTVGSITLKGQAEGLRNYLLEKLKQTSLGFDERAIIQALVLGQKKDINKDLYSSYAKAGAVHILAVSGLHVGILYFILTFILSFTNRLKWGNFIQSFLIIFCLWFFAFVTGLSPSVTRAVTMFSIFAIAKNINRESSTINNLFLSFFLLILINPLWLFHVGFQLSYLAVFSIIVVQPKLSRYYRPRFYIDKLFWGIFTVSIAAQLGVLPLSIYYFHQFPGLFFLTNIVVLPVIGILLGGGILLIILSVLNFLPDQFTKTYNFLIKSLNEFINWVANQELFVFQDIHYTEGNTLTTYFFLTSLILLWYKFNYKNLIFVLVSLNLLIGFVVWDKFKSSQNELLVFHKSRKSLIGYKNDDQFTLFRNDSLANFETSYPLRNYLINREINNYCEEGIPKTFKFRNTNILILDSLGVYSKNFQKSVVILTESPQVNLERLIDSIDPQQIIADGSNYTSYVIRWKNTCVQKKLPFHHTGKRGAHIIE
ncbi:MAG: competence protein ComEC [Flavobacteriaceae bacterium]